MKRLALVLLGCTSLVARAQDPSAEPPPAAEAPAAMAQPEPPAPPAVLRAPRDGGTGRRVHEAARSDAGAEPLSDEKKSELERIQMYARAYFSNLILGDARAMVSVSSFPFFLEDKRIATPDELLQEWLRNLRNKRTDLLTLYGVEVLTPADMEKRYGKPPARLVNFPWHGANTFVAIANLSGHASIALIQKQSQGWRVIGYHD